ncbi:hypothetical protein ABK040_000048 [Willaertia magna]
MTSTARNMLIFFKKELNIYQLEKDWNELLTFFTSNQPVSNLYYLHFFKNLYFVLFMTLLFLIIPFLLESLKITKLKKFASYSSKINNTIYGFFSLGMFIFGIIGSYHRFQSFKLNEIVCQPSNREPFENVRFIYYFSKIWEFLDICLVILQGYPINIHFRVHHTTTLFLAWLSMTTNCPFDAPAILINCFMHFFLYLYFAGCSFFFWIVRILGFLQLIVGIVFSIIVIIMEEFYHMNCDYNNNNETIIINSTTRDKYRWAIYIGLFFYLSYFFLFLVELGVFSQKKTVVIVTKQKQQ